MAKKNKNKNKNKKKSPRTGEPTRKKLDGQSWTGIVTIVLSAAILFVLIAPFTPPEQEEEPVVGKPASQTWIADAPFKVVDREATEERRQNAADKTPFVYRVDKEKVSTQLQAAETYFEKVQGTAVEPALDFDTKVSSLLDSLPEGVTEDNLRFLLMDSGADASLVPGAPDSSQTFPESPYPEPLDQWPEWPDVERDLAVEDVSLSTVSLDNLLEARELTLSALEQVLAEGILPPDIPSERITVARINGKIDEQEKDVSEVLALSSGAEPTRLRAAVGKIVNQAVPADEPGKREAVFSLTNAFLKQTLVLDRELSDKRRAEASASVAPEYRDVQKGTLIITKGVLWTEEKIGEYVAWQQARNLQSDLANKIATFVGHGLLLLCVLAVFLLYMTKSEQEIFANTKQLVLLMTVVCATVAVARGFAWYHRSGYLVPAAAGSILIAILIEKRVAIFSALLIAFLVSIAHHNSWEVFAAMLAGGLAGVLSLTTVRKRSDLIRAAVMVAIATCAVILAINLMGDVSATGARDGMIREASHGLINGLLVGMVVLLALQPLEWLFGVVTDVQLLEFSDLNHPLLRRMVLEASGSHEHSQIVGRIAQEAAEAIGANGLLARVGSYYHDIGKMAKQEYFSENQRDHNVHEDLSPAMSARIVAGHVKEGIKLAEEYKLPQPIRDIIAQHHGTSLIGFFYQNAVKEKEKKEGTIREEDFRYPGPKPQTREAAIVMLADAIESASRSLANPTLTRLQGLAERIVNSKFTDGQFDECDLTLKDLHVLAEVITRTIASASHVRLEYPEEKKKRSDKITYAGVSEPLKQNSHEDEEPRESEATMSQPG